MEIRGTEFEGPNVDVQIVTDQLAFMDGMFSYIYFLCWSGLRNLAFRKMDHTKRLGLFALEKPLIEVEWLRNRKTNADHRVV